ncbi:MAG TPA: hypothetical protein VMD31_12780 [Opitutaceae bacterium]|nr:hypothetical protein [Opitutaceae bacterium]
MNSHPRPALRGALPLRLLPAVVTLLFCPALLPGAGEAAGPAPAPAKPYNLFLGADLSVQWQGRLHPVVGVERNTFLVDNGGKPARVAGADLQMKIDGALKLTTAFASIANLKAERAYTPANDPRHHATEAMEMAEDAAASTDQAVATLNNMERIAGAYGGMVATWNPLEGAPPPPPVSQNDLDSATAAVAQGALGQGSIINSVPDAISREQTELSRELFDAFRLSFAISSPTPLADPYLVVVVRFREKQADAKTVRLLVYAQVLSPIDAKPQTVRLFRGGFPLGYRLEDYQIHLYDHGTEIATSAAPKWLALTTSEAFQFVVADYASRHRDQTLPPAPTAAFWPRDLGARLSVKKLDRTLYVKVGRDGGVAGFYDDAACTRPVNDTELEAVRPDLHFFPALAKGKSIDSVVAFNLGQHVE